MDHARHPDYAGCKHLAQVGCKAFPKPAEEEQTILYKRKPLPITLPISSRMMADVNNDMVTKIQVMGFGSHCHKNTIRST